MKAFLLFAAITLVLAASGCGSKPQSIGGAKARSGTVPKTFHALLFWFSFVIFCPILLWCLFDSQKRCLHDILAGMLAINRR
jgi:hypothetical protein